jgi:hypothetical protein
MKTLNKSHGELSKETHHKNHDLKLPLLKRLSDYYLHKRENLYYNNKDNNFHHNREKI